MNKEEKRKYRKVEYFKYKNISKRKYQIIPNDKYYSYLDAEKDIEKIYLRLDKIKEKLIRLNNNNLNNSNLKADNYNSSNVVLSNLKEIEQILLENSKVIYDIDSFMYWTYNMNLDQRENIYYNNNILYSKRYNYIKAEDALKKEIYEYILSNISKMEKCLLEYIKNSIYLQIIFTNLDNNNSKNIFDNIFKILGKDIVELYEKYILKEKYKKIIRKRNKLANEILKEIYLVKNNISKDIAKVNVIYDGKEISLRDIYNLELDFKTKEKLLNEYYDNIHKIYSKYYEKLAISIVKLEYEMYKSYVEMKKENVLECNPFYFEKGYIDFLLKEITENILDHKKSIVNGIEEKGLDYTYNNINYIRLDKNNISSQKIRRISISKLVENFKLALKVLGKDYIANTENMFLENNIDYYNRNNKIQLNHVKYGKLNMLGIFTEEDIYLLSHEMSHLIEDIYEKENNKYAYILKEDSIDKETEIFSLVNENLVYLYFKKICENTKSESDKFFTAYELKKYFEERNILRLYRYYNNINITKKLFELFSKLNSEEKYTLEDDDIVNIIREVEKEYLRLLDIEYEKEKFEDKNNCFENILPKWAIDYLLYDSYFDAIYIISQMVGYDIANKIIDKDISKEEYIGVLKKNKKDKKDIKDSKECNSIKDIFERMYDAKKKYDGIRKLGIDVYDMDIMKEIISKYFKNFLNNES